MSQASTLARDSVTLEFKPRFVKRYADLAPEPARAVSAFADEVRTRRFPAAEHHYTMAAGELEQLRSTLER